MYFLRMTSSEISTEIVKVEREISEFKREYKNLLAKVQVKDLNFL